MILVFFKCFSLKKAVISGANFISVAIWWWLLLYCLLDWLNYNDWLMKCHCRAKDLIQVLHPGIMGLILNLGLVCLIPYHVIPHPVVAMVTRKYVFIIWFYNRTI